MTVAEALKNWLYTFENIELDDRINTDKLDSEPESYGLFKQANQEVITFVNGTRDITDYFTFLARQSTKAESSRLDNAEWMETLERWVYKKNLAGELPTFENGRTCNRVAVTVGGYMIENENLETAQYQLSILINYTEVNNA